LADPAPVDLILPLCAPRKPVSRTAFLTVADYIVARVRWQDARDRHRRPDPKHPDAPGKVDTKHLDVTVHDRAFKRAQDKAEAAGIGLIGGMRRNHRNDNEESQDHIRLGERIAKRILRYGDVAAARCLCGLVGCGG
jgi:hypothetical protein